MNMLEAAAGYCAATFQPCGSCGQCTHPSGRCSGSCRVCSEEVNYHRGGRADYDCQNFMYYYMCRYAWKYCSEILYAVEEIDFSRPATYTILSLGCGGAPDLMAFALHFDEKDGTNISYMGYDANPYWNIIHALVYGYAQAHGIATKFFIKNIFDILADDKTELYSSNIVILQYLISHFPPEKRYELAGMLFDGLIRKVLKHPSRVSPTLFLLNDIDHADVRKYYDLFLEKLAQSDCAFSSMRRHFKERESDYGDGSVQYASCNNRFSIPETIKTDFDCAIKCSSAQLFVKVE